LILPDGEATESVPGEYNISILPGEVQNKFVFAEDSNSGKALSGTVHHECSATPIQLRSYRNIMKKRVREASTPQRTVQVLGHNNQPVFVPGASSNMPNSSFSDFIVSHCYNYYYYVINQFINLIFLQSPKKQKTDKEKATRMPRNELMDMLFVAFDKYPYWSFKGIAEHTKQPSQYLKEILGEICILNRRGPYTGNYQLKPEFKERMSTAERQSAINGPPEDGSSDEDEDEELMEVVV
jgi:transcription initiation factor TFIIF subunit beta